MDDGKCENMRDECVAEERFLKIELRDSIHRRLCHLYQPVDSNYISTYDVNGSEDYQKRTRLKKQALLIQCSSLFDINECAIDWLPKY